MKQEFKIKGSTYCIETGIPPQKKGWKAMAAAMQAGHSVVVNNDKEAKTFKSALHHYWLGKGAIANTMSRQWGDGPEYRVWLLKLTNKEPMHQRK